MEGEKARDGIPGNICKGQAEEEVVIEQGERPEAPPSSPPCGIMVEVIDFCHFQPQRKSHFSWEQRLKGKVRVLGKVRVVL